MLSPEKTYQLLLELGIDFFTGVPDSLLKDFCACVHDLSHRHQHVIAANEGGAVALAAGHYLATRSCPLVYLQNSGLGNTVNPLLSLADPQVYSIPMVLLVGWRGEPGKKDEPQHVSQGKATLPMLQAMNIPYVVLSNTQDTAFSTLKDAVAQAMEKSGPVAVVVAKGTFENYEGKSVTQPGFPGKFLREQALGIITGWLDKESAVIATTGKTSRELFELRARTDSSLHRQDFISVGSMGHCSQIALGVAMAQPERTVVCIDGDGAMLMHMGALAIIGQSAAARFIHIVINNGSHESVGGQPTVAAELDLPMLAKSLGYSEATCCDDAAGLLLSLQMAQKARGPVMIEIRVATGSRPDLGRPSLGPAENKAAFMDYLAGR